MVKSVTVRAPCSTANLGPGFDVFGMALDAFYDEVTVTKKPKSFGIKIVSSDDIPLDPKKNTAGIVAINMKKDLEISDGLEIKIKKKVPAGYGMGSSAASSAACTLAMNELYGKYFAKEELLYYAGSGEKASAGTSHYDNAAASLFGGFVVVNPYDDRNAGESGRFSVEYWRFNVPNNLKLVLGIPKIKVPKQKTKSSRGVLPKNVSFSHANRDLASAVSMVASLASIKEKKMGVDDFIFTMGYGIEFIATKARKKMIPGLEQVVTNVTSISGAPCTISGAGPSVIAFYVDGSEDSAFLGNTNVSEIGEAMKKGFKSAKVDCDIVICKPSKGARVTKVVK